MGERDDGRDHVGGSGQPAHGDTVAGAFCGLLAIGQGVVGAEIDEVGSVAEKRGNRCSVSHSV